MFNLISAHSKCVMVPDSCIAPTSHAAELVFARWADSEGWPARDPEVREVTFAGPAQLSARGRLRPASDPAATFSVTAFEPDRVFTDASSFLGAKLIFEHRVTPTAEGSTVEVIVGVEGFLAPHWKRVLSKNLGHAAQSSLAGLLSHLDVA